MPEWEKFKKLAQTIQGLTVGEVEGENMQHVPESGSITSVPTIKFYRVPNGTNGPVVAEQPPQQPKILNLIRNMIAKTQPTPTAAQNEVMFQEARTANNMVKFAKQNLAKAVTVIKGKKTNKPNNTGKPRSITKKRRGRPPKTAPVNSAYNTAKGNDTMVMNKLKKKFKKL